MYEPEFAQFFAAYPAARRVDNARARAAFTKARAAVSFDVLLQAVQQHARSKQWQQHIVPSLVTWLEQGYWVQTLPEPAPPASRLTPYQQAKRAGLK